MNEDIKSGQPMSKDELTAHIAHSFTQLSRMVHERIASESMPAEADGEWALKDVLTHIASWEDILVRFHIGGEPFDEVIGMAGAQYRVTSYDEVNDHLFRRHQSLDPTEAMALLEASHVKAMEAIAAFPAAELHRPHPGLSTGAAASVKWIDYIAANTYEHYDEHLPAG